MNKNKQINNKWVNYSYKIINNIVTHDQIKQALLNLYKENLVEIKNNQHILIQFKIRESRNYWRSISYVQTVSKKDFNLLIEIFCDDWDEKSEEYYQYKWEYIIFTYKILDLKSSIKINKNKLIKKSEIINDKTYRFHGLNLPATMDYSKWGAVFLETEKSALVYKVNSNSVYYITIYDKHLEVEIRLRNDYNILRMSFVDILNDVNNLSTFTRKIKNQEYIFIDGELKLKKIKKETKFLKKIKKDSYRLENFITMDIETRNILENDKEIMIPYCICIFDGKIKNSFYLTDFKNKDDMLISSIKFLMKRKYNNYRVYFHNFSMFDSVFLINTLSNLGVKITPIIKDGNIIQIKFYYKIIESKNYILYFRDSYLIMPASLKDLATNFQVEEKGLFPFLFVNQKNINLNYEGLIPEYKYYTNITEEEFNLKYKKERELGIKKSLLKHKGIIPEEYREMFIEYLEYFKVWNLKEETIKYCEQDCKTLYQIIDKFSKRIFILFRLNIHKYPTLASLSLGIYRSNFLKKENIPLITGDIYKDIKKAYTGGAVDVYKPYGKKVIRYDVNSLYPFSMFMNLMPVGVPIYFDGDISLINNKPFGIFEVEIITPDNLNIPILQKRHKIKESIRTVAGLGKWTDWYFSEELYNAEKYGYKFKILRGYLFEKENIFEEFVTNLYKLKEESEKNSVDYTIAKLLLNSLYGKFGMNPEMEEHRIISTNKIEDYQDKYIISNIILLENEKSLISYYKSDPFTENIKIKNVSIPISTAVTAYARIYTSGFKMLFLKEGITLIYSDTDSFDIDKPLDEKYIGTKLGQFKLEHVFDESVYLAPKVYGGKTENYEYIRVKGLKNPIYFDEMKDLLIKNNKIEIKQEKWNRSISESNITINKEIYTLMVTDNKRELIYDENNKLIDTKPFIIE